MRPQAYAEADWELHQQLTQWSTNPVFCLLLNGFQQLYAQMGEWYFVFAECRQHSRNYYIELKDCAKRNAEQDAENLTRRVMSESVQLWRKNTLHGQAPEEPGSQDGSLHGEEATFR
jgi:GntR family negative regulator for fad regulon and positive regulator of fabA